MSSATIHVAWLHEEDVPYQIGATAEEAIGHAREIRDAQYPGTAIMVGHVGRDGVVRGERLVCSPGGVGGEGEG